MKANEHKNLWDRIRNFSIDDPDASIKFSDKLSFQNSWTPDYTQRVIEEYKRFIFLCCISPHGASPSKDVDEAWHLHLTYTQNYWKEFCRDTLQKEIHHHPSKGGTREKHKHLDWYDETLAYYLEIFEEEAPADIWPLPKKEANRNRAISISDLSQQPPYTKMIVVLALPFLLPFLYNVQSPYQLRGPQFLVFYSILVIASLIALYLLFRYHKSIVRQLLKANYRNDADAYQLSRFVFGRNRSVQAAIIDLVERQVLVAERRRSFTFQPAYYRYSPAEKNPLIQGLLKSFKDGDRISYENVNACYDNDSTHHTGLAETFRAISKKHPWSWLIPAFVGLIGVARLVQGLQRDKPIEYLGIMMVFLLVLYVIAVNRLGYKKILERVVVDGYQNHSLGEQFTASSTLNQFAFLGIMALGTHYYTSNLEDSFKTRGSSGGGDGSSSGCGSSGCGSSCGGGGCGGCGGGD